MAAETNSPTPLVIDVVSDVVCPWCFIGKSRLEKALALKPDIPVEVRFHPYFLNPWVPREGISREQYLTTKFGSPERYKSIAGRVAQAAADEGLTYAVDKMTRQPNTLDCHRLILWAESIEATPDGALFYRGCRSVGPRGAGEGRG
jgi:predicted DsbA family dithiol-disulfide isomerase